MKISEEKLMDYADGLLNKQEAEEVLSIIKNDHKLLQTVEDLKKGLLLAKAAYDYEVENAPDPKMRSNRNKESVLQKISNLFAFPTKYLAPIAACVVVVIGGFQYYKVTGTANFASLEAEKLILKDGSEMFIEYQDFASLAPSLDQPGASAVRGPNDDVIDENVIVEDKWWVKDIIAINVSNISDKRKLINIPLNGDVYVGDQIKISLQVLEKTSIEMELYLKGSKSRIKLFNENLLSGKLINTFKVDGIIMNKFNITEPTEQVELIIKYNYKGENKIANFVFNITNK